MRRFMAMFLGCGLVLAGAANAAPVARTADLTLSVEILNHARIVITATGAAVTVDGAAETLSIPAGQLVQTTAPITIPVTASTSVASIRFANLANLTGTFSLGGGAVTTPTTELPCPTPPPIGIGCVTANPSRLGGQMALSGTAFIVIVP